MHPRPNGTWCISTGFTDVVVPVSYKAISQGTWTQMASPISDEKHITDTLNRFYAWTMTKQQLENGAAQCVFVVMPTTIRWPRIKPTCMKKQKWHVNEWLLSAIKFWDLWQLILRKIAPPEMKDTWLYLDFRVSGTTLTIVSVKNH